MKKYLWLLAFVLFTSSIQAQKLSQTDQAAFCYSNRLEIAKNASKIGQQLPGYDEFTRYGGDFIDCDTKLFILFRTTTFSSVLVDRDTIGQYFADDICKATHLRAAINSGWTFVARLRTSDMKTFSWTVTCKTTESKS